MADFCHQCAIATFGEDAGDLANITSPEAEAEGRYAVVICEGCGFIQVNVAGECVTPFCLYQHGHKN